MIRPHTKPADAGRIGEHMLPIRSRFGGDKMPQSRGRIACEMDASRGGTKCLCRRSVTRKIRGCAKSRSRPPTGGMNELTQIAIIGRRNEYRTA